VVAAVARSIRRTTVSQRSLLERVGVASLVLSLCSCGPGAAAQKAVVDDLLFVDYPAPPANISSMVGESDAVVVARHNGAKRLIEEADSSRVFRRTGYGFELIEIVKWNRSLPAIGRSIEVVLPGGEREYETHIARTKIAGVAAVATNHLYVIVLSLNESKQLIPKWGPTGVFDVSAAAVVPLSDDMRQYAGKPTAMFVAEMRAAK
jgi:hypothetical protein